MKLWKYYFVQHITAFFISYMYIQPALIIRVIKWFKRDSLVQDWQGLPVMYRISKSPIKGHLTCHFLHWLPMSEESKEFSDYSSYNFSIAFVRSFFLLRMLFLDLRRKVPMNLFFCLLIYMVNDLDWWWKAWGAATID